MLTVRTGEQIWGLLDILPGTFDKIPETLDAASKKDIVGRIGQAMTVREWAERTAAETGPEETPRLWDTGPRTWAETVQEPLGQGWAP